MLTFCRNASFVSFVYTESSSFLFVMSSSTNLCVYLHTINNSCCTLDGEAREGRFTTTVIQLGALCNSIYL